jgi:hypothetical protein
MKKIMLLLLFVPATMNAQTLSLHSGYTPINGLVGVEFQYWHLSLNASYQLSQHHFTSYPVTLTYYFELFKFLDYSSMLRGLYYVSAGYAQKNIYHQDFYDFTSYKAENSGMIMFGRRFWLHEVEPDYKFFNRLYVDIGYGCYTSTVNYTDFVELKLTVPLFGNSYISRYFPQNY